MSLLRTVYYNVKPYLPRAVRTAFRRRLANRLLPNVGNVWPILEAAATPPASWPGWPDGKKFALVLTHDVEGPAGVSRCLKLADLEASLGFRSSFNFIPEGSYQTPPDLRRQLDARGFEVGVHDLRHDGKLYRSRTAFRKHASKINGYLRDWGAVGFRSGFMHHNLDWLHDLDIAYDMSTFDTDPFEPQPDGVNTIFPFWVPAPIGGSSPSSVVRSPSSGPGHPHPSSLNSLSSVIRPRPSDPALPPDSRPLTPDPTSSLLPHPSSLKNSSEGGYVELPYTLPQDSTLFLLLEQQGIAVWKQKLDWIARHGGMALLNVHPDYLSFEQHRSASRYPSSFYCDFLKCVREVYRDQFWLAVPSEVAAFIRLNHPPSSDAPNSVRSQPSARAGVVSADAL